MNLFLWILQIILGIKFLSTAYTHGLRPNQPAMQQSVQKMGDSGRTLHSIISICLLVISIALILPVVVHSLSWLTPVAATVLAVMILWSILLHLKSRDKPQIFVSVILLILAVVVVYGRWVIFPL